MIEGRLIRGGVLDEAPVALADLDVRTDGDAWAWFDVVDPTVVDLSSLQFALALMAASAIGLYVTFKRRGWL